MTKGPSNFSLTVLTRLKKEAAKATAALERDIARREAELTSLRLELERWQTVLAAGKSGKRVTGEQRVDWEGALAALPATFTPQDVQRQTGKPIPQVYSALSRWRKEQKVSRATGGGYQKVRTGPRPGQRATKGAAPAQQEKTIKG
jgi:hypothetical protein